MRKIDRSEWSSWDKRTRSAFINQLSGAKPAFVVGTKSLDGNSNFAMFSNIIHLGADPALLGILFRPDSVPRHSLENLRSTKRASLNLVTESFLEKAHHTSARYPEGQNEAAHAQLDQIDKNGLPFLKDAPLHLSLTYQEEYRLMNDTILVACAIDEVSGEEDLFSADNQLDLSKVGAVAVGGLNTYYSLGNPKRMPYAKPNE